MNLDMTEVNSLSVILMAEEDGVIKKDGDKNYAPMAYAILGRHRCPIRKVAQYLNKNREALKELVALAEMVKCPSPHPPIEDICPVAAWVHALAEHLESQGI